MTLPPENVLLYLRCDADRIENRNGSPSPGGSGRRGGRASRTLHGELVMKRSHENITDHANRYPSMGGRVTEDDNEPYLPSR